ncbi:alanine--tRNA ligase-related protein [Streptomyces murinus]|uniref:alanine--tRNA ligase-related protein n=1 Tax=Streptomyces murinus TaxID=33900 RepID=UPI00380B9E32
MSSSTATTPSSPLRRQDAYRELSARHGRTDFVGYNRLDAEATVLGLVSDGTVVPGAEQGSTVEMVLDRSPFYAESGGQVGDTGTIRTADGTPLEVLDTKPGLEGFHVHTVRVTEGEIRTGQQAEALVNGARREAVARSHSATHVLHVMLRRTLGDQARQHGSLVDAGRLRFDFAHFSAVDRSQLAAIETLVNDSLFADPEVHVWNASRAEAEAAGATALFGEKYGDHVRIVDIGGFSRELCGGTHIGHGSSAGPVRIVGEASISSNLRRIEALTGRDALGYYDTERRLLEELSALLGTRPQDAPDALRKRLDTLAATERELTRLRETERRERAQQLAATAHTVPGGRVVTEKVTGLAPDELRTLTHHTAGLLDAGHAVVVLGTEHQGMALLAAAITPTASTTPAPTPASSSSPPRVRSAVEPAARARSPAPAVAVRRPSTRPSRSPPRTLPTHSANSPRPAHVWVRHLLTRSRRTHARPS